MQKNSCQIFHVSQDINRSTNWTACPKRLFCKCSTTTLISLIDCTLKPTLKEKNKTQQPTEHQQLSDLTGNYDHLLPSGNIWANASVPRLVGRERNKKETGKWWRACHRAEVVEEVVVSGGGEGSCPGFTLNSVVEE